MRNNILFVLVLFFLTFSFSQEKKTINEIIKESDSLNLIRKSIINKKIDSINIAFRNTDLRVKLNSELNSIIDIRNNYAKSKELSLKKHEIEELEERMIYIAKSFYRNKTYILFSFSTGIVSLSVVKEKIINDKKVTLVNYHSGTISEKSQRKEAILILFNVVMEELISKD